MHRITLAAAGLFGASSLLLVDSAVKGTVLLLLAGLVAVILRRDSAATRHMVWLLSVVALLLVPALSALLPQWRVLPEWADISPARAVSKSDLPRAELPIPDVAGLPSNAGPVIADRPPATLPPESTPSESPEVRTTSTSIPEPVASGSNIIHLLPVVWAMGFGLLILRLCASRCMLWKAERQGVALGLARDNDAQTPDHVVAALEVAKRQLGIRRPVTLLIHPDKMTPIVWGIFRYRLLLPVAARQWSREQLQSVLLHELAHVQRRDTLTQLLTQIACALHWFNPLVWLAAWRMGVERERACDDLVLASGVRPSAYAGHLLDVVTSLSPARFSESGGLAMARKSSLEGRLIAVLTANLNRRSVPLALGIIALAIAAGIAVPIAMLRAANEEWQSPQAAHIGGNDQIAAIPPQEREPIMLKPNHEYAQSLFRRWQAHARTDGKIPGALIGQLAREVDSFLKQHPEDDKAPRLAEVRLRFDASRDWTQPEVVALLDAITAISTAPVSWVDLPLEFAAMHKVQHGQPLPAGLKAAAWGAPAENGLRAAWLLEPRADRYALGTVLKARVLFHNTGTAPVIFRTESWHQDDGHTARDAQGREIKVNGTWYTGITPLSTWRLAPGDYCEVPGHGLAIGAGKYEDEFSTGSVGAIIEAQEGDDVLLTHTVGASQVGFTRPGDPQDPTELWKLQIAERVALEGPAPVSMADREQLIRRVTLDIFGEPPTAEEIAAFIEDNSPESLAALTERLQAKPRVEPWTGPLPTGETRFHVEAADPNAEKAPRTANSPGRYVLGESIHLLVSQITTDALRTNKATIAFLSPDPKVVSPHKPYEIALPDGLHTWGAVWERGSGLLWILQKGRVRKYDFSDPDDVQETRFEPGSIVDVPEALRDPLRKAFDVPDAPVQQQHSPPPSAGAKLQPGTEQKLNWGQPVKGLRMAFAWPPSLGEPGMGAAPEFRLVVQNISPAPVRLTANNAAPNPRRLMMRDSGAPLMALRDEETSPGDWLLQPGEVAFLPLFPTRHKLPTRDKARDGRPESITLEESVRKFPQYSLTAEMSIEKAPEGAWTGKLATAETRGSMDVILPKDKDAQALYKSWTAVARADGKLPGGVIGQLAQSVKKFIEYNPTWKTTPQLEQLLPRFDESHDWIAQDAVALLDELAALQSTPINMALDREYERTIHTGMPLPEDLADAPWGEQQSNGLRLAWLLEPRGAQHRLNTPLKSRILIHNAGKDVVMVPVRTWNQGGHRATNQAGKELKVDSTYWTTLARVLPYRLAPGEYVELWAAGIGVGPRQDTEDWQNSRVGSWIDAQAGDNVTVTTDPVPLGDWNEVPPGPGDEPRWWLEFIKVRIARHLPFPADADARQLVLYRIAMELFGTPVGEDFFITDKSPSALETLAKTLAHLEGFAAFMGSLPTGPTKFQVLPADPDAAKKPRIAHNPGHYTLGPSIGLSVSRRPIGERLVNEARIEFYTNDQTPPPPAIELKLPEGYHTWAAGWIRDTTVLWMLQEGRAVSYDFTDRARVKETILEGPDIAEKVPADILKAMQAKLKAPPITKPPSPPPAASSPK